MEILFKAHSGLRWLVLLVAVISIVAFLLTWLRQSRDSPADRKLMAAFTGILDLQTLLGIILLLWSGLGAGTGFPRYRLEHAFTMLLAVVLAHLSAKWKNASAALRARNYLFIVLGCLLLVYLGVQRLPQGWHAG